MDFFGGREAELKIIEKYTMAAMMAVTESIYTPVDDSIPQEKIMEAAVLNIGLVIKDCVEEAAANGVIRTVGTPEKVAYPYNVARLETAVDTKLLDGKTHNYWDAIAGFAELGAAREYLKNLRSVNECMGLSTRYSLFDYTGEDGITIADDE